MSIKVFEGHDAAQGDAYACVLVCVPLFLAIQLIFVEAARWVVVACVLALPIVYAFPRYRLTITPHLIELRRALGPIWWSRETHHLDCLAELSESWESFEPDGVYLRAARIEEPDSPIFGPTRNNVAMEVLRDRVNRAIAEARGAASLRRALRSDEVVGRDFRVLGRSPGGPPRRLLSLRTVRFRDVEIPAASLWVLNREGWVDPARRDSISAIHLASPTTLPNGIALRAGGRLCYSGHNPNVVHVHGAPNQILLGELAIDGGEPLACDRAQKWKPVRYVLAGPALHGNLMLPAGTRVGPSWLGDSGYSAVVGGPMQLTDVQLAEGDTLFFDRRWRLACVSLRRRRAAVGGRVLSGDLCVLSIRRNGRINIGECRRRGLLE